MLGSTEFPRSLQRDCYSCGARSCYMVSEFFGLDLPYSKVKRLVETDHDGTRVKPMIRFFRSRGLKVAERRTTKMRDLEHALEHGGVVLVHVDGDHFAVVHAMSAKWVWLADPSIFRQLGRRICNFSMSGGRGLTSAVRRSYLGDLEDTHIRGASRAGHVAPEGAGGVARGEPSAARGEPGAAR